jgi:hypothetical protein
MGRLKTVEISCRGKGNYLAFEENGTSLKLESVFNHVLF